MGKCLLSSKSLESEGEGPGKERERVTRDTEPRERNMTYSQRSEAKQGGLDLSQPVPRGQQGTGTLQIMQIMKSQ